MFYSFVIRRAVESDAAHVFSILQQAFQEYGRTIGQTHLDALRETIDDIRRAIAEKTVLIAIIDNEVVGTLRLEIRNSTAYLSRFAVCGNRRGVGIGEALMNTADKYLISQGVREVTLHTASRHTALMRFYYCQGFFVEAIETDRGYHRARLKRIGIGTVLSVLLIHFCLSAPAHLPV